MVALWKDDAAGVRVVRLTKTTEIEKLIRLFEAVASEENWQPDGALRHHVQQSVYFALLVNGQLAGGLQLVVPCPGEGLPCQTLWPEVEVPVASPVRRRAHMAHVSVLALEAAYRGRSALFWMLAIEMWRFCVGEGIATLFIEVTPRVLPLYRRLGWPLCVVGAAKLHWGEECVLCTLGIPDVARTLLVRAEQSHYYGLIIAQAFRMTQHSAKPTGATAEAVGTAAISIAPVPM